jgi:hypothetical protein
MKILDSQPFSEKPTEVWTPDGIAAVKPFQIVVWVSLAARPTIDSPLGLPRFPAILDPGTNHNFTIRQRQLERWAKIPLSERGTARVAGLTVPLMAGRVWIHRNQSGKTAISDRASFRLNVSQGIVVYPEDVPNPARLPILGLRPLVRSNLKLIIDGKRRAVTLKTPGWF